MHDCLIVTFRYGEGYTITIKVVGSQSNYEKVQSSIKSAFQNAMLKESHCNMLIVSMMFEVSLRDS